MKTLFVAMMAVVAASSAQAEGFKCEGVNTGVNVNVYNHVEASAGTRKVAIMIVSDSYVNSPNKTIAKFTDDYDNNTLSYLGNGVYQAKVDLRYIESRRKGENVGGTKLGQLQYINLHVFKSGSKMKNGEATDARISYIKRNGEVLEEKAICTRYLKD
jgi:hypothetical protein